MAIIVELLVVNGQLTVCWPPAPDEPVAKLKGHWRGPLQPVGGTGPE